MKKKLRIVLITLVVVLLALIIASPNKAFAAARTLRMNYERPYSDDDGDGTVGNDIYRIQRTGSKFYGFAKIYDKDDNEFSKFIYCLRGGKGFGAEQANSSTPGTDVSYNEIGEMHTEPNVETIINILNTYSLEEDGIDQEKQMYTSNGETYNVNLYNAILWIADNAYLPKNMNNYNASEYKKELLDKAGVAQINQNMITDDDIEVVQQLAFWYFANYDEQIANNDGSSLSISAKDPFAGSNAIKVGNNETYEMLQGSDRRGFLDKLYNYFVDNAIANASIYGTGASRTLTNTVPRFTNDSQTNMKMTEVIRNNFPAFKIGPFKVTETISSDEISLTDIDNQKIASTIPDWVGMSVYDIATSDAAIAIPFEDGDTDKEEHKLQSNTEYYIYLYKSTLGALENPNEVSYNRDGFKLKLPASYYTTTVNFLATNSNEDQPLLEILKDKESIETELTVEKEKKFDLALRKFITKINGQDLATSRVPEIEIANLKSDTSADTTAKYKHPKNTLTLKRGDEITYTIRVYNEGELDGYAKVVKDYLPDGLELVEGKNDIWQVDSDGKTLSTDALANEKILAYDKEKTENNSGEELWQQAKDDSTGLYYRDLIVVCRIKDSVQNDAEIKNVAEIFIDESDSTPDKDDRDSTPGNVYEDETHTPGNETDGYTPGEQDDDDFEKVTVDEKFDLALRKYITAVENAEGTAKAIKNRNGGDNERVLTNIDVTPLTTGETTADYKHRKDPVAVETGDIVTYTLRVYNEGDIDGTVTEIKDILPEGVELYTQGLTSVNSEDSNIEIWEKSVYDLGIPGTTCTTRYAFNKVSRELTITRNYYHASSAVGLEGHYDNFIFKLKAYNVENQEKGQIEADLFTAGYINGLNYGEISFKCRVTAGTSETDEILTNVARITGHANASNTEDRDSQPETFTTPNDLPSYTGNDNIEDLTDANEHYKGQQDDDDFEKLVVKGKTFDLALRKYITGLENAEGITKAIKNKDGDANTRSLTNIDSTEGTTADYKHRKDPVAVETGDIVTYTLKVYNEGDVDGFVTEIKDILPEGLVFIEPTENINSDFVLKTATDKGTAKYEYSVENGVLTITPITDTETTTGTEMGEKGIFDKLTKFDGTTLDYGEISFKCKVTAKVSGQDKVLTNVARITADRADATNPDMADRDSQPETFITPTDLASYKGDNNKADLTDANNHYKGQQDDDDFEKLVLPGKNFDLALRKFITKVNGKDTETNRKPKLDMTKFESGESTTARYVHPKDSVVVKQGDIVTYKIRVYNEGQRDGYAAEVTDYLPEGLGFLVDHRNNIDNAWSISTGSTSKTLKEYTDLYEVAKSNLELTDFNGLTTLDDVQIVAGKTAITSSLLENKELKAYDSTKTEKTEGENWQESDNGKGTTGLYYQDIEVTCIVLAPNTTKNVLRNIAEITKAKDSNNVEIKNPGDDRDSVPATVKEDEYHKPTEDNGYWPGEEDDDDFEPIILQYFDLALRKFITKVDNKPVTTRYPQLSIDEKTGNIVYKHPKEEAPVEVATNNIVTYTLRIYNEGTKAGYADLVTDDIPEGLEFLPDNATNKQNRWVMYRELGKDEELKADDVKIEVDGKDYVKTDNVKEASIIQTDYLSKEQGATRIKEGETVNPALLTPFDNSKGIVEGNPDYADIQVAFKVLEPNTSDRVIINSAQISHDTDDKGREVKDEDSETNKWNDGEDDDQDREYIKVKYFDLSLYKWVTKTIVTVDGETKTTETGFKPNIGKTENITEMEVRENSEEEPIAAVSIDKKKLNRTSVKFAYSIMVMNEGEIAGSASEIKDFIPEGLEFNAEDNTAYGWEQADENTVVTRCLDGVVLQPGESATVEIVFTWKNSEDNLGLKTNVAEITEDFNEYGAEDIDSKPDNKEDPYDKEQEDDDDFALVILELMTGSAQTYFILTTAVLSIIAAGIILIKKYVLR